MSVWQTVVPSRAYRWNYTVMGLDLSLFVLGLSFVSVYGVMPLYVHHLTASNLALGLIATVRAIGSSLPPILAAPRTERLRRKKRVLAHHDDLRAIALPGDRDRHPAACQPPSR